MCAEQANPYQDILHMPRPVSAKRPGMDIAARAAQFAPFSALTGYDSVIRESGRLTDGEVELTDSSREAIWEQLNLLQAYAGAEITVTYYVPDDRKTGGSYVTVTARVKKVDSYAQQLVLTDGRQIPLPAIYQLHITDIPGYPPPTEIPDGSDAW